MTGFHACPLFLLNFSIVKVTGFKVCLIFSINLHCHELLQRYVGVTS